MGTRRLTGTGRTEPSPQTTGKGLLHLSGSGVGRGLKKFPLVPSVLHWNSERKFVVQPLSLKVVRHPERPTDTRGPP